MQAKLGLVERSRAARLEATPGRAASLVREAARRGANIVLLPELFESVYFPQLEREECFALAHEIEGHPFLGHFQARARDLGVVLPLSFFERAGQAHFNSVAMVDADGRDRKSTRLNSSHSQISYAVFCLKNKRN